MRESALTKGSPQGEPRGVGDAAPYVQPYGFISFYKMALPGACPLQGSCMCPKGKKIVFQKFAQFFVSLIGQTAATATAKC